MALNHILKRAFSTSSLRFNAIKNVTVIGGGLMGSGIAQVAAQTGHHVTLVEVTDNLLRKGEQNILNSLTRIAKKQYKDDTSAVTKFVDDIQSRIVGTTNVESSCAQADVVIEAIVEQIQPKHDLFRLLDKSAPEHTIFASNTSSLSIADIAAVTQRRDRFGGLHFFNPVPMMKLLEVVRAPETSVETHSALMAFGTAMGKTCIACKDTPGFVVNRLLVPYLAEATRMMERGDASAQDIDIAMKLGAGYPMGPLELADYVGLDTTQSILEGWYKKYPDNPLFKPMPCVYKLIKDGKLGRKTGEGFYKYK